MKAAIYYCSLLLVIIATGADLKGRIGSASGTAGGSRADFSFPARLPAGKYAAIPLPEGLSPVGLTDDGTVILQKFGFDGDAAGYRWKSGQLSPLSLPDDFHVNGYLFAPITFQVTHNGWVMGSFFRLPGPPSTITLVWPPAETNPVRLPAPQFPVEGFMPVELILEPIINAEGKVWAKVIYPVSDEERITRFVVWDSIYGDPRALEENGWAVAVAAVNASGALIGTYALDPEDPSSLRHFARDIDRTVDFEPRLINDAGWIVGSRSDSPAQNILWKEGREEVLLPEGEIDEIDPFNNLHGYTPEGNHVMWTTDVMTRVSDPASGTYQTIDYVPPVLPDGWTTELQVIPGDRSPKVGYGSYIDPADPQALPQSRPVLLVPATLAVDADHNGEIELADGADSTSADNAFRFWINDDNDSGDVKPSDAPNADASLNPDGDQPAGNGADDHVNGIRDLVDFFPVYLDIKQLLTLLPPGVNGVSYWLRQEDAAVGVVCTDCTRAQAFDYLRGIPARLSSGFGLSLTAAAEGATVTKITSAGVNMSATSPAFFSRLLNNDGGVLLVEAARKTNKPLVLEARQNGNAVASLELPLKIDPVGDMIHWYNIRSLAHATAPTGDNRGPHYADSGLAGGNASDAVAELFPDNPTGRNVVYIHGYNIHGREESGTIPEMFKRLYWGGSKARFYAVLWRGDDVNAVNFQLDVGHAWQQAPYVRKLLNNLPGDTVVIAHSAGNMVTMAALCYETVGSLTDGSAQIVAAPRPAHVKNYFAIDAAVPLEALSDSDRTETSRALMRHHAWIGYDERLWPTHWHRLFPSGDGRHALTWLNVFGALDIGTNLYSSGDEVLENPDNDDDIMPVWDTISPLGHHAWVVHEKAKGGQLDTANPAKVAGETMGFALIRSHAYAGWGFNQDWYTGPGTHGGTDKRRRFPSEAGESYVPTSALPTQPFFAPFQDQEDGTYYPGYQGRRLLAPLGDAAADAEARRLSTFAKVLGEGMPGLSFAQGSNPSVKFDDLPGRNFNLNTDYILSDHRGFKNGWPVGRGTTEKEKAWKHGDYIIVSYNFIFPLFEKIVNDGDLN